MDEFGGFFGHRTMSLDDKFRLRIPTEYHDQFPDGKFTLCKSPEGCIMVLTSQKFMQFVNAFRNIPTFQGYKSRLFNSSVERIEEDKQGRFILSKQFRDYAKIDKKVEFVGNGDVLEIWGADYIGQTEDGNGGMSPEEEKAAICSLFEEMAKYGI